MNLLAQDMQLPVLAGEREECQLEAHFRVAVLQGLEQKNHLEGLKAGINEGWGALAVNSSCPIIAWTKAV